MRRSLLVPIFFAALSLGCPPPIYGVLSEAEVSSLPSMDCVRDVLLARESVDNLEYSEHVGGRSISLVGIHPGTISKAFVYDLNAARFVLQFFDNQEGEVDYIHYGALEEDAPAADLQDVEERLRFVAGGLQESCRLPNLLEDVRFRCRGDNCGALPWHAA